MRAMLRWAGCSPNSVEFDDMCVELTMLRVGKVAKFQATSYGDSSW